MKAYMSARATDAERYALPSFKHTDAQSIAGRAAWALDETARILAETEPPIQRDGRGVCMIRVGVRSSVMLGRQGQDALAAALAAFVEG